MTNDSLDSPRAKLTLFLRAQMPNISAMEIAELRPFFSLAFTRLKDLDPQAEQHRETEEWWMRDPGGCMDAVRTGQLRNEREGTAMSAFAGL